MASKSFRSFTYVLLICSLLCFLSGCASKKPFWGDSKSGYIMMYRIDPSEVWTYESESEQNMIMEMMGSTMETTTDVFLGYRLIGKESAEDENIETTLIPDSMRIAVQSGMGDRDFDLSALIGKSFGLTFTRLGKKIAFTDPEQIEIEFGQMGGGKRNSESFFNNLLPDLPAEPVKIGDSWNEKKDEPREVTPAVAKYLKQVNNQIAGIDVKTGQILWRYTDWHCMNPIPNPTPVGDDRLFITGGYEAGSLILKVKRGGASFGVSKVFDCPRLGSQISYPILFQDHLYFLGNGNFRRNGLVCMDLNGTIKWRTERRPEIDRGHMILVGGRLIAVNGRDGLLHLIEPSSEGYKEISQVEFCKGSELWGPIGLSDGKLLVRADKELWCLNLKRSAQ